MTHDPDPPYSDDIPEPWQGHPGNPGGPDPDGYAATSTAEAAVEPQEPRKAPGAHAVPQGVLRRSQRLRIWGLCAISKS